MLERVQEIPGVKSAAVVRGLPFTFNTGMEGIALLDRETPPAGREPRVIFNVANGNFFSTAQIPLQPEFKEHDAAILSGMSARPKESQACRQPA